MKYLLVGKTGFFDTLGVASGFSGIGTLTESPYFADLDRENSGTIIRHSSSNGNELYVCGYKFPEIVKILAGELNALSKLSDQDQLRVIPVSITGQDITWILTRLANLPVVGSLFLKWAKSRTLARQRYLYQTGQELAAQNDFRQEIRFQGLLAAKPGPQ